MRKSHFARRLSDAASISTDSGPLAEFLRVLFAGGDPRVGPFAGETERVSAEAAAVLRDQEARFREELAGEAPLHDPAAAGWAAGMFYHACQFLVDRDADEATVRRVLARPHPGVRVVETDYAVDLVFRFLPDLLRVAAQRAPGDALTEILRGWTRAWPLSSVGVVIEPEVPAGAFLAHPSLRRLYLDRIFARAAKDRLNDPALRRWIAADSGPFPEFAAGLTAAMPSGWNAPIRATALSS